MILCIDAGNSRLKWGLWNKGGAAWHAHGIADYGDAMAAVSLPLQLSLPVLPQRILACNVAGAGVAARIEALAAALAVPLAWFRSSAAAAGVRNGYAVPTQLGADRWAALIGARARHTGSALVVMAGTATTIDVLDATGVFRGGLILPGLDLMRRALAQNTAALPEARGCFREIPANTDDAIVSGSLVATLGAIERMARRMTRPEHGIASGPTGFACLLSGGTATALAPHLDLPLQRVDNLVLDGLAQFADSDEHAVHGGLL